LNGPHGGTIRYEYGNTNLKSETSKQIDGGFEFNTTRLSINFSELNNSFSNFVFIEYFTLLLAEILPLMLTATI